MTDPALRPTVSDFGAAPSAQGDELGAIAWSWAAAIAAGLDSRVAFHPDAYRGEGEWLQETSLKAIISACRCRNITGWRVGAPIVVSNIRR
jgi:hypothetical protein